MRTIESLLTSPVVYRIGWALLHSLWQSAAVALMLAVMLRWLRRAPAEARYLAACVALVMMVALPAATSGILSPAPVPVDAVGSYAPARWPGAIGRVAEDIVTIGPRSSPHPAWLPPSARSRALLTGLVAAWMVGVTALALRLLCGWLLVRRLTRRARPLADPCDEALRRLARDLRIRRAVRLLESSLVQVPMVIGGLRPMILLPIAALTGLPPGQLEALLAHELAHIRRHDYLINLAQSALEVLLFYHPAAWWASRVIRAEREHCCDDLAVRACGDRLTYARALAAMEGLRGRRSSLSPAADGGPLLSRIRRILKPEVESMNSSPVVSLGAALLIGTVLPIVVASAQPSGGTGMPPRGQDGARIEGQAFHSRDHRIRTVYVPVFRSNSFRRDVTFLLTMRVLKESERWTRYKVVGSREQADTILAGTINFAEEDLVVEDPFHLPRGLRARVQATVRLVHNPPLESELDAPPVVFEATIDFNPEVGQTSKSAFFTMCSDLATQIVDTMERPNPAALPDGLEAGTNLKAPAGDEKLDHDLDSVNDQEARRTFFIGDYYQRTGKLISAEYYFGEIRRRWPKSSWAAQAKSRLDVPAKLPRQTALPDPDGRPSPPLVRDMVPPRAPSAPAATLPILPGERRVTRIFPRNGSPDFSVQTLKTGVVSITVIRGGCQIVSDANQGGIIDVSADSAIIWRRVNPKARGGGAVGLNDEQSEHAGAAMEVYLEGNVLFLQDERKAAGNGGQKTFRAKRAYYDFHTGQFVAVED